MTNATTIVLSRPVAIPTIKGKGKAARTIAFMAIAPYSFSEDAGRTTTINNLRAFLGETPIVDDIAAAKLEWSIGRAASRLPAGEYPSADMAGGDKLDYVRCLFVDYAAPVKEGTKGKAIGDKVGRRTPLQHRVIRNAEEAWSQIAAELGIGKAKTQAERNAAKKTRAPQMTGSSTPSPDSVPTHAELVKPVPPLDADGAAAFLLAQSSSLLGYANKNAALLRTDFAVAVRAFRKALLAAEKVRLDIKAQAEAKAVAKAAA